MLWVLDDEILEPVCAQIVKLRNLLMPVLSYSVV